MFFFFAVSLLIFSCMELVWRQRANKKRLNTSISVAFDSHHARELAQSVFGPPEISYLLQLHKIWKISRGFKAGYFKTLTNLLGLVTEYQHNGWGKLQEVRLIPQQMLINSVSRIFQHVTEWGTLSEGRRTWAILCQATNQLLGLIFFQQPLLCSQAFSFPCCRNSRPKFIWASHNLGTWSSFVLPLTQVWFLLVALGLLQ